MTMNFLPVINIQHDFPEVISDLKNELCLAEDIWISCYRVLDKSGTTKSVHGKVRVTSDTSIDNNNNDQNQNSSMSPINLAGRDGVECRWADHSTYSQLAVIVSCQTLSIPPTLVSFPTQVIKGVQTNGIECMDVAGDWIVTGGKNGKLRLDRWRTSSNSLDCNLDQFRIGKGHVSDLTSCQFFPSGEVILTTSIDMTAKIYSINPDPSTPISSNTNETTKIMMNVRSLGPPHGRGVGGGGMIGKGKEIVTFCRDGKLRLWNLAESKVVIESDTWSSSTSSESDVLAMKVVEKRFLDRTGTEEIRSPTIEKPNDQFFLILGLSTGALHFVDLPTLKPIKLSSTSSTEDDNDSSPIDAIAVSPFSDMVAYGTRSGRVRLITLNWRRSSSSSSSSCCSTSSSENMEIESLSVTIMASWQRMTAAINSLEFIEQGTALLVAGDDGLPYRINNISDIHSPSSVLDIEEFAGFDCDPVSAIRSSSSTGVNCSQNMFAAGKDGHIRIWSRSHSP
ncbi:hypothetical protein MJO28_001971 [Puccinia striiformis f. sp. tritici]|uniref:Uncharacterized protein n=3 Tax=Puccinia striiformis TaxID=27350 RepID=A0A0L0VEW0_9BASI|nr:hypothetical protein Pst134EA_002789 [Puccinia striiformis f. sp. tritici]KAI9628127.1 hypothetical protein KEM48_011805 [Puccinia striiformis f. sp. tritici PST-130]KNE97820.1 hypothetical protein PSTG_08842 [Puccinia striiformis f. sp. tritici PST-78]KAH9464356.1 hypothetical protein Pst134EB_003885 [Puccinia striiformis f. sp. tritici]KAH9472164.1 hypothetical protein Pst134EA_002789 [Puccinia striiformis f. sp. tritici]KAI7961482.1 hypothetical protein MJO28_001971 [Puccinia striiformis